MNAHTILLALGAWSFAARLARAQPAIAHDEDAMSARVTYSSAVRVFAEAIAAAEGFGLPGAIPTRLHNPGDLKVSSVPSIGADASGHLHFATDEDGWEALHRQVQLIVDGRSRYYTLDMTIAAMGARYAESSAAWASNVARVLGVSPDTTLRTVLL